jgi:hypothetical protein
MGLDCTIRFSEAEVPTWDAIRTEITRLGEEPQLRMIDGLPAFPDEIPEVGWKELRLGLSPGMVTVRHGLDSLTCVIWNNGDAALQQAWFKVICACAKAGSGLIETPEGPLSASQFSISRGIVIVD